MIIKKILIANRAEIASRIIRSCQDLGIQTVAVYTPVDRDLPYVRDADQAIGLPSNDSLNSYLNIPLLLEIAIQYGADAIHPGYGFLAENAEFARACQAKGLIFIGPEPDTIEKMGSKITARKLMQSAGIPVVPGFEGQSSEFAEQAQNMGYPVLIKASAGGGGRGMRLVNNPEELETAIKSASNEALKAFGDSSLLLEKYLSPVRHIEVQIVGDGRGQVWHLFERECSLQRRYQKVIEEAPAPNLRDETRQQLYHWALKVAELLHYKSLGTVEFAVDADEQIYFLECNTRIQVEHPVTEAITGLDLVALQLEVANGHPLNLIQDELVIQGHAIECRLYAEDPDHDFAPSTGQISHFKVPQLPGYRCDTGIQSGSQISVYYDAMLAKLITHGSTRQQALARMQRCLQHTQLFGLKTNLQFLSALIQAPQMQAGQLSTSFIPQMGWVKPAIDPIVSLAALIVSTQQQRDQAPLKSLRASFRNLPYRQAVAQFEINGVSQTLEYSLERNGQLTCSLSGQDYLVSAIQCKAEHVSFEVQQGSVQAYYRFELGWQSEQVGQATELWLHHPEWGNLQVQSVPLLKPPQTAQTQNAYISQVPGKVLKILVEQNQAVKLNQALFVIESMKMETQILAQADGVVRALYISEGQLIESGKLCLEMS